MLEVKCISNGNGCPHVFRSAMRGRDSQTIGRDYQSLWWCLTVPRVGTVSHPKETTGGANGSEPTEQGRPCQQGGCRV